MFDKSLGQVKGYKAKIIVDSNAIPEYMKARSNPYYYREKVDKELNRLVGRVEYSEWALPILAVTREVYKFAVILSKL